MKCGLRGTGSVLDEWQHPFLISLVVSDLMFTLAACSWYRSALVSPCFFLSLVEYALPWLVICMVSCMWPCTDTLALSTQVNCCTPHEHPLVAKISDLTVGGLRRYQLFCFHMWRNDRQRNRKWLYFDDEVSISYEFLKWFVLKSLSLTRSPKLRN